MLGNWITAGLVKRPSILWLDPVDISAELPTRAQWIDWRYDSGSLSEGDGIAESQRATVLALDTDKE